MYRSVLLSDEKVGAIKNVYDAEIINKLNDKFQLFGYIIGYNNLEENKNILKNIEYAFSTWGMPQYDKKTIQKYFPNLKCIFYAAGSVKNFAENFLNCGVKIFSAWKANAVPVAEYTVAQIVLANKGFFRLSAVKNKSEFLGRYKGNYDVSVGLIGLGSVGSEVAERLKKYELNVFAVDPYASAEKANNLNVKLVNMEEIFKTCDVISNHLPDIADTYHIINYKLFSLMKPYSTFINTGRGRQVVEEDMIKAFKEVNSRTALLDVTFPEPPLDTSPLYDMENIILTPHIAGSSGNEVHRMSLYMYEEALRYDKGEKCLFEITKEMLNIMA